MRDVSCTVDSSGKNSRLGAYAKFNLIDRIVAGNASIGFRPQLAQQAHEAGRGWRGLAITQRDDAQAANQPWFREGDEFQPLHQRALRYAARDDGDSDTGADQRQQGADLVYRD